MTCWTNKWMKFFRLAFEILGDHPQFDIFTARHVGLPTIKLGIPDSLGRMWGVLSFLEHFLKSASIKNLCTFWQGRCNMQMHCKYNANDMQLLMQMSILSLESTAGIHLFVCNTGSKSFKGLGDICCFGGKVCYWRAGGGRTGYLKGPVGTVGLQCSMNLNKAYGLPWSYYAVIFQELAYGNSQKVRAVELDSLYLFCCLLPPHLSVPALSNTPPGLWYREQEIWDPWPRILTVRTVSPVWRRSRAGCGLMHFLIAKQDNLNI